jgi:hypothetical protein
LFNFRFVDKPLGKFSISSGTDTPKDLHSSMARFFLGVLKKDGTVNEPDSLSSMYYNLDRPLRDMNYAIRYVLTFLSFKIVKYLPYRGL